MEIFLFQNGKETGPYTEAEVRDRLTSGKISPDTQAATEGSDDWRPVSDVLPEPASPSKQDEPKPSETPTDPRSAPAPAVHATVKHAQNVWGNRAGRTSPGAPAGVGRDPNEDEPDARRYPPDKEERLRSFAWLAVGLLYLLAFFWPTQMIDGLGIVNFQFEWANKNLSWAAIPLMVWPGVAGLVMGVAGFLLRGRLRGGLAVFLSFIPILLIMMVSSDGHAKILEAFSAFDGIDLTTKTGREAAMGMVSAALRGLVALLLAWTLGFVILAGVFSSIYIALLFTPHAARNLRPNSTQAYYFGVIGGIILILVQLLGLMLGFIALGWSIFGWLFLELGLALQIAAVILGFINFIDHPTKRASRRAALALALGVGGLLLIGLTLLVVPMFQGGLKETIGMYAFKIFIWLIAAALVFSLGVLDLWLGKAADTPQNN